MRKKKKSIPRKERGMSDAENVVSVLGGIYVQLMNSDHEFKVRPVSRVLCFSAAAFSRMGIGTEEVHRFNSSGSLAKGNKGVSGKRN